MASRFNAIEALCDGDTHTLVTAEGRSYANVRVDALKQLGREVAGAGIAVAYEIVYTQLGE